jgi:DNA primase
MSPARAAARAAGTDDWIERVRAASDVVEVIGQTVALRRAGRNWIGLCPFHAEKTPSFSVNAERQFYHCFGCKAGGDVFKFVQEIEKVGFLDAAELLSRRAGIPVPERRAGERGARTVLLEVLEAAAAAYEQWLGDPERGATARAYLERRGLARDTIRAFRLGLAPDGWENLTSRLRPRFADDTLVQAGLAMPRTGGGGSVAGSARQETAVDRGRRGTPYDRFRNRLMVPLVAPGGAVLGFGARALGDEQPKYLNSPETPVYHKGAFLFALEHARREVESGGEVIVVEGYFDAIVLHQAGVRNVVATSGTALTPEQARALRRLAARVVMTYDGDAAGQQATLRSLGVLLGEGLDVLVTDLPPGQDPDTLVRELGAAGWAALRAQACDPVEFVQRHVLRAQSTVDARERALQAVVELSAAVSDPVRLRLLLERAAQVFGMPARVLDRAVTFKRSGQRIETPLRAALREQTRGELQLEGLLLRALLHAPGELEAARQRLSPEDFRDPAARELALRLWGGAAGLPEEGPAASLARELASSGSEALDWRAEAAGATERMVERRLKQELRERRNRLGRAAEGPETARLMQEIDEIARSLRELHTQVGNFGDRESEG